MKAPLQQVTPNYEAMYQKERERNERLKDEVQKLRKQLLETIHPGGSLVHAY